MCSAMSPRYRKLELDGEASARAARISHRKNRGGAGLRQVSAWKPPAPARSEVNAVGRVIICELSAGGGRSRAMEIVTTIDIGLQELRAGRDWAFWKPARRRWCSTRSTATCWRSPHCRATTRCFVNGLSRAVWNELRDNPRTPLINKCIRGQYPPGSTFKMIGLAALEAGVAARPAGILPGLHHARPARFHCWKERRATARSTWSRRWSSPATSSSTSRLAGRRRRHRRHGATVRPRRRARPRSSGRAAGADADQRMEAGTVQAAMAEGRDPGGRHRPGLVLATPLQLAVMTARIATAAGR